MARRSEADRRFILAHEVWHCALGHMRRQLGRDQTIWNQACDYEVNHLLSAELGHCPADALWDRRFRGLSAEEVYHRLVDGVGRLNEGQGVIDEHDLTTALETQGEGQVLDPDFNPGQPRTEAEAESQTEAWRQRLVAVAQQRERMAGDMPGHLRHIVGRIRQPAVPWQQLLARFLRKQRGGDRQWLPPSRRHVHRGLYLPSRYNNTLEITVAVDNSGSCANDIPGFLAELKGMLSAFNRVQLQLLVFDTCIQQRLQLNESELYRLTNLELKGGGGTDFEPVFEAISQKPPDALVILTDGCARAPEQAPSFPVLWALTHDGQKPVDWGEELHLGSR
jgi:predicted metal-dependent peptidase